MEILKQTREEKVSMYAKLPKSMLIEMLINCNDVIEILTQEKNCVTPKEVEKEYEILTLKKDSSPTYRLFTQEKYYASFYASSFDVIGRTKKELLNRGYAIYSVKRLSDGEIFTVGDKVRISKLQHDGSFIIDRFYFDCNNNKLLCNGKCTGNGHVSITKIEKVKKPLFTTEDGVDIYEGDIVYWVSDETWYYGEFKVKDLKLTTKYLYFSTKEKVEEYILMNKPCLSINDILLMQDGMLHLEKKLKELVKSKI